MTSSPVHAADSIAQKLHACTGAGSERAQDLVDLQLLDAADDLDMARVRGTAVRLFAYLRAQLWPPTVVAGLTWSGIYEQAALGLDVLPDIASAVAWANDLVGRIESEAHGSSNIAGRQGQ